MVSKKQTEANQRNAQKSTGPKTPDGKAIVRFNALKHGLRAENALLLPGEDGDDMGRLAKHVRADLNPVGEMEHLLVERIIAAIWRLRRASQIETGILAWEYYGLQSTRASRLVRSYEHSQLGSLMGEPIITDELKHEQALQKVREIDEIKESEIPTLGLTFMKTQDAFTKLARYETSIERSLYRALDRLERLQASRKAQDTDPIDTPVPDD